MVVIYESVDRNGSADIRLAFQNQLLNAGLFVEREPAIAPCQIYLKLTAPFDQLCKMAEKLGISMPLNVFLISCYSLPANVQSRQQSCP